MNVEADDKRWLALAESVSAGAPIDWDEAERQAADPEEFQVLRALRSLEDIARVHSTITPESDRKTDDASTEAGGDVMLDGAQRWQHLVLLQHIGQGAFGSVYRARDERLDSEVALKLLWPKFAAAATDNSPVIKEARLLARVRHANVVRVYGAEIAEGRIGIWMELIKGRTLSDLLTAHGPFGAREAAAIGIDLCSALAAVHSVGLLHRDVKARNVMREEGGRIVLMDFGAGTDLTGNSGGTQDLAGTPLYLAPELFDGRSATSASDIYSLGVLLYHLVSGAYPVDGNTHEEIGNAHRRHERKPLLDCRPDLPEGFVRVIERALSPQPEDRYASAGSFAQALGASVGVSSTRSHLDQRSSDTGRGSTSWLHSPLLAAAAVLFVACAAGLFWWKTASHSTGAARPSSGSAVQAQATPEVAEAGPGPYQINAKFHAVKKNGKETVLRPGASVEPGDMLYLTMETSVPTFVYVVNQDENGESVLEYPLPDPNAANALPAGTVNRIPGRIGKDEYYWQVTSAGGREHFFVVASPERLVAFEKTVAALPRPRADQPVLPLTREAVGMLRSVGGLAKAAPATTAAALLIPFATPLLETAETVRGYWAREITLENPAKKP